MGHTKKVGSAGRFRAGYGRKIRLGITKVEAEQHKPQACPYCSFPKLKRMSAGIWECTKCSQKFAGGAYFPTTPAGRGVSLLEIEKVEEIGSEVGSKTQKAEETGREVGSKTQKKEQSEEKAVVETGTEGA